MKFLSLPQNQFYYTVVRAVIHLSNCCSHQKASKLNRGVIFFKNFTDQIWRDGNFNQSSVFLMLGVPCQLLSYKTCVLDVIQSYQPMIGSGVLELSDKMKKNLSHFIRGTVKIMAQLQVTIIIIHLPDLICRLQQAILAHWYSKLL